MTQLTKHRNLFIGLLSLSLIMTSCKQVQRAIERHQIDSLALLSRDNIIWTYERLDSVHHQPLERIRIERASTIYLNELKKQDSISHKQTTAKKSNRSKSIVFYLLPLCIVIGFSLGLYLSKRD